MSGRMRSRGWMSGWRRGEGEEGEWWKEEEGEG
jgi:hypothetical protein